MKNDSQAPFKYLLDTLHQIIKVYRELLAVVRAEKDILIAAKLDDLNENNRAKEAMVLKIQALEETRHRFFVELCSSEGLNVQTTLSQLSVHFGGVEGDRLQSIFSTLELLVRRVKDLNSENEILVQSALNSINGAMNALKESLNEKVTYQKKGSMADQGSAGQFVSREA